ADGALVITVHNDKAFRNFAEACGYPEWADDPRFLTFRDRMVNGKELLDTVRPAIARQSTKDLSERLKAVAVPCGVVRDPGDALTCDYTREQNLVHKLPHPTAGAVPSIASPFRLSETPGLAPVAAPLLGQHTAQVLHDLLGYDDDRIAALAGAGSIALRED